MIRPRVVHFEVTGDISTHPLVFAALESLVAHSHELLVLVFAHPIHCGVEMSADLIAVVYNIDLR